MAASNNGTLENITVSHEIEERATAAALIEEDEDDDEDDSGAIEKDTVDQGAFQSEPEIASAVPPVQATVSFSKNLPMLVLKRRGSDILIKNWPINNVLGIGELNIDLDFYN